VSKYSDIEILNAIAQGANSKVFLYLYEKIFPKVKNYILKNNGDIDESKDIFQDALLIFCTKVKNGTYTHQTEIDGFIYAVSRNLWINRLKTKAKNIHLQLELEEVYSTEDTERLIIFKEREQTVEKLFNQLGEVCRKLLLYTIYDKLTMSEVCKKMNFANENVAKTKNYKCKQRLISLVDYEKSEIRDLLR